ncbi:MAG TPA: FAD-binding oxidoreductase [Candidatus Paceibacterota bacterium]|nr:FAD-binding oxidoreductase [Candidatus Paceibacterota bacterium]
MQQKTKEEIAALIEGEVRDDAATLERLSKDASIFTVRPSLAVAPRSATDVEKLVEYVAKRNQEGERLTVTARSAGTDMTGGPLNEGIILEFTEHMNALREIGADSATVEPGMYYRDFEKATLAKGLLLPSYTASKDLCAVGGMVANNSGGEKTLVYGKTEKYVRRLKVVLSDGSVAEFEKLTMKELEAKKKLDTLEGQIYRKMHELCESEYDLIKASKPNVTKNSSGYYLWNVYDRETGTFDLTQVIVGSQGTLGIVTEIEFALVRPHTHTRLAVVFLKEMKTLPKVIHELLSFTPESLESYDDHTFRFAIKLFPMIVKRLGGSIFGLALRFWPEFKAVLTGGLPKLILLAEFSGDTDEEATAKAEASVAAMREMGYEARVTTGPEEAEKYWVMRRESFNLLRQKKTDMRTASFIEDFAVHPDDLPTFLPKFYALLDEYDLTYTVAGHMGDANFHIIPLMDMRRPDADDIISALMDKVYRLVLSYRGTITAEHNDGLIRSSYVPLMYGDDVVALFERTKDIFDPHRIFNPGKKVFADRQYALEHMVHNNLG